MKRMQENKITIIISKPVGEVFDFTTDPKNTHQWIPSIREEIAQEYPPRIGTLYKNRGDGPDWNHYKVVGIKKNKIFMLSDMDENYHVKYTYRKFSDMQTEMEYFEWMTDGEIIEPFTEDILQKLKSVMESH